MPSTRHPRTNRDEVVVTVLEIAGKERVQKTVKQMSRAGLLALCAALAACQSTPPPAPLSCPPPPPPTVCPAPVICPEPAPAPICPEPPPPPPPPACPPPKPETTGEIDGKLLVGEVEFFNVQPGNMRLEARIDTGATTSSLHAVDIVQFERDGQPWVRFKAGPPGKERTLELPWVRRVRIKGEDDGFQRRPVVMIEVAVDGHRRRIEVTLNNRGNYEYPLLIGRNFLRDNCIVDVSRKHVLGKK